MNVSSLKPGPTSDLTEHWVWHEIGDLWHENLFSLCSRLLLSD